MQDTQQWGLEGENSPELPEILVFRRLSMVNDVFSLAGGNVFWCLQEAHRQRRRV